MRQFIESGEQVRDEWRNDGQEALQQSRNDVPFPRRETHIQVDESETRDVSFFMY